MTQRGPTPATPRKKRTFEQEIAEDAEKEIRDGEIGARLFARRKDNQPLLYREKGNGVL